MTFAAPSNNVFDQIYLTPVVRLDFENAEDPFEELEIDGEIETLINYFFMS